MKDPERQDLPSASSIDRLSHCPGSHHLSLRAEPIESGLDAERGNRVHKALELGTGSDLEPDEYALYEDAREQENSLVDQWQRDIGAVGEPDLFSEHRLWCINSDNNRICSAKVDRMCSLNGRHLVIDFKTGYGQVLNPAKNSQLRTAAACLKGSYSVRVAIIQPTLKSAPPCDYDAAALMLAYAWLLEILTRAREFDAPLVSGEWCQYCPARMICPELGNAKKALAVRQPYEVMTPDVRRDRIPLLKLGIKLATEELDHYKKRLANDPNYVDGYCLKPGRIEKPVGDVIALYGRVKELVSDEEFCSCVKFSKEALANLIAGKLELKGKALDAKMAELFDGLLVKKQTAPTLAESEAVTT